VGINAAHRQIEYLIDYLDNEKDNDGNNWADLKFPRPYGERQTVHNIAVRVSRIFPMAYAGIWLLIIMAILSNSLTFR
jgi:hypothetical protein